MQKHISKICKNENSIETCSVRIVPFPITLHPTLNASPITAIWKLVAMNVRSHAEADRDTPFPPAAKDSAIGAMGTNRIRSITLR